MLLDTTVGRQVGRGQTKVFGDIWGICSLWKGQGPQVCTYQAVAAVMRAAKLMKRFLELRALSMGVDIVADGGVGVREEN